jgi:hypothetical protein
MKLAPGLYYIITLLCTITLYTFKSTFFAEYGVEINIWSNGAAIIQISFKIFSIVFGNHW